VDVPGQGLAAAVSDLLILRNSVNDDPVFVADDFLKSKRSSFYSRSDRRALPTRQAEANDPDFRSAIPITATRRLEMD
jgi:hypothetical protein